MGEGSAAGVPWGEGLEKGDVGRLEGERFQTGLHTLKGVRHPSAARTSLLRPRAMAWAEATQSHVAWRARAGAIGGGSAARCRWRSILRSTSAWVMAAIIRSDP